MAEKPRNTGARASRLLPLAAAVALPFAVFVAHGALFSGWEIDDAGISYAYARNLAAGHGLVAQPGLEPVEGFTNLLWVLLLAPLLPLVEAPGTVARALSQLFVLGAFIALTVGARAWFPRRGLVVSAVGLTATALVTGFTAWTLSGLENGLLAGLVALFVAATTLTGDTPRGGVSVGLVWIALFATRPDTAPLALVPVVSWSLRRFERSPRPFAATAAAGLFLLTAFRALYFGDVLPNTYYAKAAPGWELLAAGSWRGWPGALFGLAGALLLLVALELVRRAASRAPWPSRLADAHSGAFTLWLTLVLAYLAFEALPTDWMPEGRFATTLFLLGPLALLGSLRRRPLLAAGCVAVLLLTGGYAAARTPRFVDAPPAPFDSVLELSGRLAAVGDALGAGAETTVLLPDIGGALWADRFRVVDLGGLIDRRIGRLLHAEPRARLLDELFDARRPDVIWVHGFWKEATRLESDPRLEVDYRLLHDDGAHELHVRSAAARRVTEDALASAFARPCGSG